MTAKSAGPISVVFKPDRLTFVVAQTSRPPRLHLTNCHYFTVDGEYRYVNFMTDFGPLNLAMLYRFCDKMNFKLANFNLERKHIVLYTNGRDPAGKINAAYLIGSFAILYFHYEPSYVAQLLRTAGPFTAYRDAAVGPSSFDLHLEDCLHAVAKASQKGWLNFPTFNVQEYETYETVENGDFNWIVPGKFLAFCGPHTKTVKASEGYPTHTPEFYHKYFKFHNVTTVVRTNTAMYDSVRFTNAGFKFHDLFFIDGTTPTRDIILKFLEICNETIAENGAIAVHCKAGLGRTGTLIACYLMKEFLLSASVAIAWIRICRPGSILGPQQNFLKTHEAWLWSVGQKESDERSNQMIQTIEKQFNTVDLLRDHTHVPFTSRPTSTSAQSGPWAVRGEQRSGSTGVRSASTSIRNPTTASISSTMSPSHGSSPPPEERLVSTRIDIPRPQMTSLRVSPPFNRRVLRTTPPDVGQSRARVPSAGSRGELPPSPMDSSAGETFEIYQPDLGVSEVKTQGDYLREMKTASQRLSCSKALTPNPSRTPLSRTTPPAPQVMPRIGSTLADCQKLQMEMQTQRGQSKPTSRLLPGKKARVVSDAPHSPPVTNTFSVAEPLTITTTTSRGTIKYTLPGTEHSYKLRSSVRDRFPRTS